MGELILTLGIMALFFNKEKRSFRHYEIDEAVFWGRLFAGLIGDLVGLRD